MFKSVLLATCAVSSFSLAAAANAQTQSQDAQPVEVTVIARATHIAPSSAPLDVVEPTSSVQAGFLKNNIIPLASIDDVIKFQPSIWSQNPNGPGIGKAEEMTLRGFQDGQYNVTFDGIPFGDATDLHHTSGSLFIAHDLQTAVIDRGPGTGATIGKATFGGTIGFLSKDIPVVGGVELYGTAGSFNTKAYGVELDSGKQGGVAGFFDYNHESTDGYLTHSNEKRDNLAGKMTLDLDASTTVTVLDSWNHEFQYTTQGATLDQYAKYGDNYGLCSDPKLQCYYGYQPSNYFSDFEYIDVKHTFGNGVRLDNNFYHNGFEHDYQESKDASDDVLADNTVTPYTVTSTSPLTVKKGTAVADIPGKRADAVVNSLGDILRLEIDTALGTVKTGFWVERQSDHRYSLTNDITKGYVPVIGKLGTAYSYLYKDTGDTFQPYVELDWKPNDQLTVIPGVKYTSYRRSVEAVVNKTVGGTLDKGVTYSAWQPSLAANYKFSSDWSGYAQVAKGFLAPPIDTFNINPDQITDLKPEETMNYQVGTSVRKHSWTLGADLYYIDFDNYLASYTTSTNETAFKNAGGAIYKGVELEAQYALPNGLSLYGNYSYNDAKYKHSDVRLAEAPEYTAALGLLYDDSHGLYYSVIGKEIGPRFGDDGTGTGDLAESRVGSTFTVDLAAGYHFHSPVTKNLTASIKVGNLLDSHKVVDYAGSTTHGGVALPLYWLTPGRSVFFNLDAKF